MSNAELFHGLTIPHQLALEFFITFSRFEYALKQAGFVKGDENRADPDWGKFGTTLARLDTDAVLERCSYMRQHPPKKQIIKNGQLDWKPPNRSQSKIENILLDLRTIRNNVFHGGKFSGGEADEPMRDQKLIEDCLALLNALLELTELQASVAHYFKPGN